ncbi:NAD(P)H-dependent flavin oxidoreductase [Parasphingorhabdus halotolerans]|uniref:Nitronate monooxygenase n=1 Tax=Parasphingorhabdus halotolerans TaxID=2725558 RepID=A0A6H2DLY1_9SPHN|nr:nitronate monooxygenase family protein [Parasphingorhabdus halotolerans]QJB69682.1 nitronate monooxygenase [Parasphingorhabdus halotolerans]
MKNKICNMLGIEFPLVAFSHCRDVVAAVSKAGGMGVFGGVNCTPETLEEELSWIDDHVGGKPYGLDIIVPNKVEGRGEPFDEEAMLARIPAEHIAFTEELMKRHGVDAGDLDPVRREHVVGSQNLIGDNADAILEVAFRHPIKLIANALGIPPQVMLELGQKHDVPVAALVGTREHAMSQVAAGVDIIIAVGGEAGGHTGDVATMVLIPEVCNALTEIGEETPVLAAGGIATGAQMAAAMAMGAAGVWCGSVWLTTVEAETNPIVKEKMLLATSRDTVRARSRTGKPSRQLRSPWTDAWEAESAPTPLPMPLQSLVSEPPLRTIDKLSQGDNQGAKDLATYWVGQGVGLMNEQMTAGQVVQEFKEDFLAAYERLAANLEE